MLLFSGLFLVFVGLLAVAAAISKASDSLGCSVNALSHELRRSRDS